ncbi:hypothetical protein GCM10029964_031530 [Kibdelosporangium lantanae]
MHWVWLLVVGAWGVAGASVAGASEGAVSVVGVTGSGASAVVAYQGYRSTADDQAGYPGRHDLGGSVADEAAEAAWLPGWTVGRRRRRGAAAPVAVAGPPVPVGPAVPATCGSPVWPWGGASAASGVVAWSPGPAPGPAAVGPAGWAPGAPA